MNALSEIPIFISVERIEGHVPSPTPIVGVVGDSTSVTRIPAAGSNSAAMILAVSHPAVPPPKITMCWLIGLISVGRFAWWVLTG